MSKEIFLVVKYVSDSSKIWKWFLSWLEKVGLLEDTYQISGKLIDTKEIFDSLNGKYYFGAEGALSKITFSQVHGQSYKIVIVKAKSIISPDFLVHSFLDIHEVVQAFVVDSDYDYWQNAKDPTQYTSAGKPLPDLPMKSNGLPFPLEQQIFDTSQNPGRFVHRGEYVEAIGSPMWFSDKFWAILGKQGPSFPVPGVEVRKLGGLTVLDAGSEGFDEHSSVEIQNLLRQSIYG